MELRERDWVHFDAAFLFTVVFLFLMLFLSFSGGVSFFYFHVAGRLFLGANFVLLLAAEELRDLPCRPSFDLALKGPFSPGPPSPRPLPAPGDIRHPCRQANYCIPL